MSSSGSRYNTGNMLTYVRASPCKNDYNFKILRMIKILRF